MRRRILSNKRGATFETFNWFLLFMGFALMVTALFSLFVKLNDIDRSSLGNHADAVFDAYADKNLHMVLLDENVNIAAQRTAFLSAKSGGNITSDFIMGAPIIKKGSTLTQSLKDSYLNKAKSTFVTIFAEELKKELDAPYPMTDIKLNESEYSKNSISFDGDNIIGYALHKITMIRHANNNPKLGNVTVEFLPNFRYSFDDYSISDYNDILEFLYMGVMPAISSCNDDNCVISKINGLGNQRFIVEVNKRCVDWFNGNNNLRSYLDLYSIERKDIQYANNVYFLCIEDTSRQLFGKAGRDYDIFHPVYNYAIDLS
ncbi:hypothetical protein H6503_01795 [Candidatus Woesearchaeota archaeon]|nr:hypothetical protein [Candidatus Woesearchaeota archaeon]